MKTHCLIAGILLGVVSFSACGSNKQAEGDNAQASSWENYPVGHIVFDDQAPETEGSKIYHRIVTDPKSYIAEQARTVLSTLYYSLPTA